MKDKKEILRKTLLSLVIAVFIIAMFFNSRASIERLRQTRGEGAAQTEPGADAGERSRAFNFMLVGPDGAETAFSAYRGSVVLLVFWDPSEEACVEYLTSLARELVENAFTADVPESEAPWTYDGGGITAVAVAAAAGGEYIQIGAAAQDAFAQYCDTDGKLERLFMISAYPATYVFNAAGELCGYQAGAVDAAHLGALIEKARQ